MKKRFTRREVMVETLKAGTALGIGIPLLEGCSSDDISAATSPVTSTDSAALPDFRFTDSQRRALSAAVSRLIPAQGPGDWSAADAGAVEYIEKLLNSFPSEGNPRVFGGGPVRQNFARFHVLSRVKLIGWQHEVLRLRTVYSQGLDELNRLARGPLSLLSGDFASLAFPLQDAILESIDLQNTDFFAALYAHTMEGVYGHPVYGGNRDYIAWRTNCYQGDVHGVRFPGGHDPDADDRPWDKYGGYSPEEMGLPSATCSGSSPPQSSAASTAATDGDAATSGLDLLHRLAAQIKLRG